MSFPEQNPIVLFDGVCNYCNRWVNFIIRHDKKMKFRFAPLQSEAGKKLLKQYEITDKTESVVLIYNEQAHVKSTAGLHILFHLGGLYALPFALVIVPAYIRDFYYDIIARNRYKWWGKMDRCMIPTEEIKNRFL
jgi:predicted DCC family thiol-disulfide oxidoreductase YuxK